MRKTVYIAKMIQEVNRRNVESTCSPEVRRGWNALLEGFLHDNGVYEGFRYLEAKELGDVEPGIAKDENGNNVFPDESRVAYYFHHTLKGGR